VYVDVVGWSADPRPIFASFESAPAPGIFDFGVLRGRYLIGTLPPTKGTALDRLGRLRDAARDRELSAPIVRTWLAGQIRRRSVETTHDGTVPPSVGSDVMTVTIPRPGERPRVRIEYVPLGEPPLVGLVGSNREVTFGAHGTFTPWIVTPDWAEPPQAMLVGGDASIGGLEVEYAAPPPPPGSRIVFASGSMPERHRSLARIESDDE
jgi:hypothetical protein